MIVYGKGGALATDRRDEHEMIGACLRILQAALVYVNTLMLQDVLDDPPGRSPGTQTGAGCPRCSGPTCWSTARSTST